MARNIFLSILTLIAGICIGVFGIIAFVDSTPAVLTSEPTLAVSPSGDGTSQNPSPVSSSSIPADTEDNRVLLQAAFDVAAALKETDYQILSSFVHPVDGVIFVPYSTVEPEANVRFTPSEVARLDSDSGKYVWGISDGKGDPLEMTAQEYFARYVYNADYTQAPMIGIDQIIGSGNALENVSEVFPDARFVEFYFPGLAPEYNGFDWCGLKLVFSLYQDSYKLSAIIHSEWTI